MDYILAEFKGTYRAPNPDGIRDQQIVKPFHVRVKMKRECLKAPGLNGFFDNYYKNFLKRAYPEMIELYQFQMVQATELDGSIINDPKALSHEGLLAYIKDRKYPINALLFELAALDDVLSIVDPNQPLTPPAAPKKAAAEPKPEPVEETGAVWGEEVEEEEKQLENMTVEDLVAPTPIKPKAKK
jgi:hypothetical protein